MVYQLWYWVKSLRVWENVALPLLIGGISDHEARHRAIKVLEEFGLSKYMNLRPTQLSGGEQQRVGLARALINNPWIILADEPTGNLDTHASDQIIDILQDLNVNKKRTVVMVTHNPAYDQMANVKIEMRDGRIIKEIR
jgi:ABC-type lipoprotein export system ATPase subunit